MPGFMQSLKSHLPQSPFSPIRKNSRTITPTGEVASTGASATADAQPVFEVLPADALLQPNSSTVALTLTSANGESSQQLSLDQELAASESATAPAAEESAQSPVEDKSPQVSAAETEAAPAETQDATVAAEPIQPVSCETAGVEATATDAATAEVAAAPEVEAAVVEPSGSQPDAEASCSYVEESAGEADASVEASTPVAEEFPAPEGALNADATAIESTDAKPAASGKKENFSCHVKRIKSKKNKSDVAPQDASDLSDSAAAKPRKSNPLAGKFRSVIDQVRSKVKKDKEAAIAPPVVITPPTVAAVEPILNADTAVSA